jgi:hypothetical protein
MRWTCPPYPMELGRRLPNCKKWLLKSEFEVLGDEGGASATRGHDINFLCQKREALHAGFKVPMLTSADRDRVMNKGALSGLRHLAWTSRTL